MTQIDKILSHAEPGKISAIELDYDYASRYEDYWLGAARAAMRTIDANPGKWKIVLLMEKDDHTTT